MRVWYVINHSEPFVEVTLQVGSNSTMMRGPWNCPCTSQYPCSYIGDYEYRYYNNIPAGSTVSIEVKQCINGEWISIPVTYGGWFQQFNYYQLNYTVNYVGDVGESSGNGDKPLLVENMIRVYPTTPPECELTNDFCDEIIINPIEFNVEEYDNTVGGIDDVCNNPNELAYFSYRPKAGRDIQATNFWSEYNKDNIQVCFNRQGQFYQFKVIPNPNWNVVVDLCYDNILNEKHLTIIESIEDIEGKIPTSLCFKALRSFKGHFVYPYNIEDYGYAIKDVLLAHERVHKKKFKDDYLEWYYPVLNQLLYKFRPECDDYNDLDALKTDAYKHYNFSVSQYADQIGFQYAWYEGLHEIYDEYPQIQKDIRDRIENDTNTDPDVTEIIQNYITALENYCNSNQ